MESKKEVKPVLKYTNKENMQTFSEGDAVICFTGRKICTGTIVAFCNYKENKNAYPQCSVYIDTSRNNMSRSCEIINLADITYMGKIPTDDLPDYPQPNEAQDKSNFIEMIVSLGHDKEKAEIMYKHMKELIALYNIPLSVMLICVIRETDLSAEEKNVEELIDISNKLVGVMGKVFQSVTDSIKEARIPGVE